MAQLPLSSLRGICRLPEPSSSLEFYVGEDLGLEQWETERGKLGEREVGVKAEEEGIERGSCKGRDGTGHPATDPLLYDIIWRMLHCSEPSLVPEKAESESGEGAGTAFLFSP